ncbi:hypothetical protein JCM19992_32520 [Thermostilla marina]
MTDLRHIELHDSGDVTVVHFKDRKIIEDLSIQELAYELFRLVEQENRKKLLLNFANVDFLSSGMLGQLMSLEKKVKAHDGVLKLCCIQPAIMEVFTITQLDAVFDIYPTEADALAAF